MKGWQEYMMFYGDNSIDIDEYANSGCYMDDFFGYGGMSSDDGDSDSGNNEIQQIIRARIEMGARIKPATLWRSKATSEKNLAECEGCKNKAVQCVCEDEWCLDDKHECKAFKRHSECCLNDFAEKLWQAKNDEKEVQRLHQSYNAKRENAQVSFCTKFFIVKLN